MLKWYEQECEKEQNIIASRVRFARNWNEYVFPSRLSEKDGREMVKRLDEGLTDLGDVDGRYYEAVMLEDLDELERQVLAVAEEIEKDLYLKDDKRQPRSREGLTEGQWVLLDYGDFVIHVMHQESRDYYRLERLWKDCPSIDLQLEHAENTADETVSEEDAQ